jgi:cytochrome d ubiquinol oxidase subunit I
VMVGVGLAMLAVSWLASWKLRSLGSDRIPRWLLRVLVAMTFSGWIATLAGWYTTEIGRQPWLVQGVLKTAEALGPVPAGMVMSTLIVYLAIYAALTASYIAVLSHLARKAAQGPSQPATAVPGRGGAAAGLATSS